MFLARFARDLTEIGDMPTRADLIHGDEALFAFRRLQHKAAVMEAAVKGSWVGRDRRRARNYTPAIHLFVVDGHGGFAPRAIAKD